MRHPNRVDLTELRKMLNQLRKEAVHWGLPNARISDIDSMEKVITALESKRGNS